MLVIKAITHHKFLPVLNVPAEVNRPLWSRISDSFCGNFLYVGGLADNRPVWSRVTKMVGGQKTEDRGTQHEIWTIAKRWF
jgi:hypothetical protein